MNPAFIGDGDNARTLELGGIVAMEAINLAILRRLRQYREKQIGELLTRPARATKLITRAKIHKHQ